MFKRLRRRRAARRQANGTASHPGSGLQVCASCHADCVYPAEWHEADDEHWWMLLRCGACAAEREATVPDAVAKRYGDDLDAAQRQIEAAVEVLDVERMAREAAIFAEALERDLIDAGDFARQLS